MGQFKIRSAQNYRNITEMCCSYFFHYIKMRILYTTWNKIRVIDVSIYICVHCTVCRYIAHHNRVNKELWTKSLKSLATECSVQSS